MTATEMQAVPENHPAMVAWLAYKATPEFLNTKQWAVHAPHTEGSLWAAFIAGMEAVTKVISIDAVATELEHLREEVAYWRSDLSARLFSMTCSHDAALARGEMDRVAAIAVHLRPALASYYAARDQEWHARCGVCGEFVRPDQPRLSDDEISGHAGCVSDGAEGSIEPSLEAELPRRAAEAEASLNRPEKAEEIKR